MDYSIKLKKELSSAHEGGVTCLLLLNDMELVVSAGNDKRLCVWDSVDGNLKKSVSTDGIIFTMERFPEFKGSKDTVVTLLQRGKHEGFCLIWSIPNLEKIEMLDFGEDGPFTDDEAPVNLFLRYFEQYKSNDQFISVSQPFLKFHNNLYNPLEEDYRLILNNERLMDENYMCVIFLKTMIETMRNEGSLSTRTKGVLVASTQKEDGEGTVRLMFLFGRESGSILGEKEAPGNFITMCTYLRKGGGKTQAILDEDFRQAYDLETSSSSSTRVKVDEVLVTSGDNKKLIFWDMDYMANQDGWESGELYEERPQHHGDGISSSLYNTLEDATIECEHVQLSLLDWDDTKLISGDSEGTITLWDIEKKKAVLRLSRIHNSAVTSLIWIEKNRRFMSGSYDGTIKVFEIIDSGMLELRDEKERVSYLLNCLESDDGTMTSIIMIKTVNISVSACVTLICL